MRAVLWDMDGTLVDTEPVWQRCEKALVARFGGVWTQEQAEALLGQPLPVTAAALRRAGVDLAEPQIIEALMTEVIEALGAEPPWRPGARDLLVELHEARVPLALVTMSYRPLVDALLNALPPGLFSVLVTGDRVAHGKPHPEPYLTGLQGLGVAPLDALAVEDSPPGVASILAAGVPGLAVPHLAPIEPRPGLQVRPTLAGLGAAGLEQVWQEARSGLA